MDREIPKEVRDKERKKKFIKYGAIGVAAVKAGALPGELVEAFEQAWSLCKADSPEYFTLYKGAK